MLIIKTGETEFFHPELWNKHSVSLGEVLRFTPLVRCFSSEWRIDWLTSHQALPLLQAFCPNDQVRFLTCPLESLGLDDYEIVLNLELAPLDYLKAQNCHAFGLALLDQQPQFLSLKGEVFSLGQSWSENFLLLTGRELLAAPKKTVNKNLQVAGLNYLVGDKLPDKKLTDLFWSDLCHRLKDHVEPVWQKGEKNLNDYLAWIRSVDILFTHDSLGLHLADLLGLPTVCFLTKTKAKDLPTSPLIQYLTLDSHLEKVESAIVEEILDFLQKMRQQEIGQ